MNYKIAKGVNIILGIVCLVLEIYIYIESEKPPPIDAIYLVVVSVAVLEAITSLILTVRYKTPRSYRLDTRLRAVGLIVLVLVGGLMIYSALQYESGYHYYIPWQTKLVAGILCVVNGILHCAAKSDLRPHNTTPTVYAQPMVVLAYPGGQQGLNQFNYQQNPPSYEETLRQHTEFTTPGIYPQQIYQIPSQPVQPQNGIENQNFNPDTAATAATAATVATAPPSNHSYQQL